MTHSLEVYPPENGVDLDFVARAIRFKLVQISHAAGTAHLGGALSCVDILVAAYWKILRIDPAKPDDPLRDRFILSKGHAATALYTTLAARGYFPLQWLDTIAQHGSPLAEQPAPRCAPGVELATGSLGHGLPTGLGMALAARIQRQDYRVFVLMSDGECNEGTVWEAALFAPAHKLDQLVVIVDYNKWQATGRSNEIMALPSLREKFAAFGWDPKNVPDPQAIETFERSKVRWDELSAPDHATVLTWHTRLISLRKRYPELTDGRLEYVGVEFDEDERWLTFARGRVTVAFNLGEFEARIAADPCHIELASSDGVRFEADELILPPDSVAILLSSSP